MRQVIVLGGLLSVALVGSYMTWTAEDTGEPKAGEAVVYKADVKDISRVVWTSDKLDVELRPSSDDKGDYVMVHVTERREKPKPRPLTPPKVEDEGDDHGEEGPDAKDGEDKADDEAEEEEPAEIETVITYFKGNESADELLASLAPLVAMRELEIPADADQSVFGFDDKAAKLEIQKASGPITLAVGGETFGSKDRYVRLDKKTYLVDDQTLRPLQYGKTRLLERNLQPLAEKEIESIEVVAGERKVTFAQQNADDRTKSFWADASTPDTEHEVAGTWLGKAFKMRAREYVEPKDLPELKPVFTYKVTGAEKTWTVDISQDAADDGKFYAQADFLRATVELTASLASDTVADLDSLFPTK